MKKAVTWLLSILFILAGFGGFMNSAPASGAMFLIAGVLLLPPVSMHFKSRISKPSRAGIIMITLVLAVAFMTNEPESNADPDTANGPEEAVTAKSDEETAVNAEDGLHSSDDDTGELTIIFIDVGQGDSILVGSDDDYMLIDAGEEEDLVSDYLEYLKVGNLDYVIGTHPHDDHIGGLNKVIDKYDIGTLILPTDAITTTQQYEEVLASIDSRGYKITEPVAGDEYTFGDAKFIILAPNSSEYSVLNNYSVVIKLIYGDTSFLLTGDAEEISEQEMLDRGMDLTADVLKLGHHGASSGSSEAFLNAVKPGSAVVSVGKDNPYGHPGADVINRVVGKGIDLYKTDELGTIIAISDGQEITFNVEPNNNKMATSTPTRAPTPTTAPTPSQEVQREETDTQSITVYITRTGSKYHRDGCRYLRQSRIAMDLENAKKSYDPCSVCDPPQ